MSEKNRIQLSLKVGEKRKSILWIPILRTFFTTYLATPICPPTLLSLPVAIRLLFKHCAEHTACLIAVVFKTLHGSYPMEK